MAKKLKIEIQQELDQWNTIKKGQESDIKRQIHDKLDFLGIDFHSISVKIEDDFDENISKSLQK